MAYGLTRRIFKHALSEGWIKPADICVDPFGGIGSTGIVGAHFGVQCVMVELEQKFVDLARQNFELHRKSIEAFSHFGAPLYPVIIQGDSRKLAEIISACDCVVGSPPFQGAHQGGVDSSSMNKGACKRPWLDKATKNDGYGQMPGQLGAMKPGSIDAVVSSPPYSPEALGHAGKGNQIDEKKRLHSRMSGNQYGDTEGQLSTMKSGSVEAIISSPPYAETDGAKKFKTEKEKARFLEGQRKSHPGRSNKALSKMMDKWTDTGTTPGNLGNLKPGKVGAIISSPPWERQIPQQDKNFSAPHDSSKNLQTANYGKSECQLGNEQGQTFWQAAKIIVEQCHQILKPGGVAIFVVKSFVRKGKKVDFPGDWQKLCESVGFETLHEHHAMLFKPEATGVFDFAKEGRKERHSFFRRNAHNKGAWRNYWNKLPARVQRRWLSKTAKRTNIFKYKKLLVKAQETIFKSMGEVPWEWNEDIRIDYEVILCMRKP
jgi:hypothetical protein